MTGYEPRTSEVWNNSSTSWATQPLSFFQTIYNCPLIFIQCDKNGLIIEILCFYLKKFLSQYNIRSHFTLQL